MSKFPLIATEKDTQQAILEYLELRGHFCWRNNTGGFYREYKGKRQFIKAGIRGSSDIIGTQNGTGKMIAIECKRNGEKPTVEQTIFLEQIRARGGIAIVAYSIDDVMREGL